MCIRSWSLRELTARLLNFRDGELPLALLAALFYFFVLCAYFMLRPVREAMGVSRGMDDLRWLFIASGLASLLLVLAFGGLVSRWNRRRFIAFGYAFVIACLILFAALLIADALRGGGLIGTDAGTAFALSVGYTFYVWLSVINLFVNTLFWTLMVDLFTTEQGKRMFAFIGIGGTLGAIGGGLVATLAGSSTDSVYLAPALMLVGATLFAAAIVTMLRLERRLANGPPVGRQVPAGAPLPNGHADPIGGDYADGVKAVMRSRYLAGIAGYVVLMAISNTMIYFTVAQVVLERTDAFSARVGSFAQFDLMAQFATLITQVFITTRLIRRIGVGWTLTLLPMVTVAGFAVLAIWPLYGVMAIFQAVHRATRYAVSRPARETLFGVVPPADKYKAKSLIDVFLYRGGDIAGALLNGLMRTLGLTLVGLAAAALPLAAIWGALSLALGRAQQRRDVAHTGAVEVSASIIPDTPLPVGKRRRAD
jgi:ATP:ADP antiporter, AAA family